MKKNFLQDPHPRPNPEQTASLFSLWTYGFLDHIVAQAYRVPHIPRDQLPPLADYDHAKTLVEKSFPVCVQLSPWRPLFAETD